jgi:cation transport regulator ChaB
VTENYHAERTVSAIFKEQEQVDRVIQRLLEQDIPRDYISVMGKNFQSQTRIAGFISKRDVILGGLRTGAIWGSLFGSFLSLLTGVGVLFIPFVGPLVAAGPIGAVLLGGVSGALVGSAGAGLASAFVALGMPEDKATIYQTRLEAGEFLVMAEVPSDRSDELQTLMANAGGEDIHTGDMTLPRPGLGRYDSAADLSPEIRAHLSEEAQKVFIERYNSEFDRTSDQSKAEQAGWEAVHHQFDEDENGLWSKQKVAV